MCKSCRKRILAAGPPHTAVAATYPEVQGKEGVVREQAVAARSHDQVPAERRVAPWVRLHSETTVM